MRAVFLVAATTALVLLATLSPVECRKKEDARIIAAVSTWTQLSFVTFTTEQFTTCATAVNAVACRRRKLRRFHPSIKGAEDAKDIFSSLSDLDDSIGGNPPANKPDKAGKLAVTIWSSVTSTFTMTMTSINTATTYSLSFACSVVGADIPPACGG